MNARMLPRGIPGPRILPLIGSAWTYLPLVGTGDDPHHLHETYLRKYKNFGEIFAEKLGGKTFISLFNPKDFETVFQYEGRLPARISHDILLKLRRERPELFASGGITPTNGEEWYKLRKEFQGEILNSNFLNNYVPQMVRVSNEFINHLLDVQERSNGTIPHVLSPLHHWALENICEAVLDTRMDAFSFNRKSICYELIDNAYAFFENIKEAEYSQTWKLYRNKVYRQTLEKELYFYNFIRKYVDDMLAAKKSGTLVNANPESCMLRKYLEKNLDVRDVITTVADFVLAGLISSSVAASVTLHHLGSNRDKQEVAYREILKVVGPDETLTVEHLNKLRYVNQCIKESLRFNPVTIGNGRVLNTDVPLSGFQAKKGTIILTHHQITGLLEKYVPRVDEFLPERHVARNRDPPMHPMIVLPFSFGARSCVGKHFAMQEINILVTQILRKYTIVSRSPRLITMKTLLINIPETPIDIQLIPRETETKS